MPTIKLAGGVEEEEEEEEGVDNELHLPDLLLRLRRK